MKRKGLIAIICSALILAMAVPGTLALAADESGSESLMTINVCTCNTEDGIHTTDCSLYEAGEEPTLSLAASSDTADATNTESDASDEDESNTADTAASSGTVENTTVDDVETNTADTTSAETASKESATALVCTCGAADSVHKEDCPLYDSEAALYQKLIATKSQKEFDAIIADYAEKNLAFTCEEFDNLEAHYYFLSTGKVLDRSPVVDEVSTTVNFTNVAPLIESGN